LPRENAARSVLLEWSLRTPRSGASQGCQFTRYWHPKAASPSPGDETGGAPIGHLKRPTSPWRIELCFGVNSHVLYMKGNPQARLSPPRRRRRRRERPFCALRGERWVICSRESRLSSLHEYRRAWFLRAAPRQPSGKSLPFPPTPSYAVGRYSQARTQSAPARQRLSPSVRPP
jgi:hypothetical protein